MRVILNLMNETKPWEAVSSEIHQIDIFQRVRNAELTSAIGADGKLQARFFLKNILAPNKRQFLSISGGA